MVCETRGQEGRTPLLVNYNMAVCSGLSAQRLAQIGWTIGEGRKELRRQQQAGLRVRRARAGASQQLAAASCQLLLAQILLSALGGLLTLSISEYDRVLLPNHTDTLSLIRIHNTTDPARARAHHLAHAVRRGDVGQRLPRRRAERGL